MKHFLTLALLLITLNCLAQPSNSITIGKIDSLRSTILNETRRIWVHVPASAGNSMFSERTYPVLYLLDGPGHFHSVTGMVQQLSIVNGNSVVPEMIVVGIQNTDRTRDLTPTRVSSSPYGVSAQQVKTSGGADNFLAFMEKELMPYIDSTYPVAPYRMLVGHSLGGLLAVHTLLTKPEMFNAYIAIDPSLWWDEQVMVKKATAALQQQTFPAKPFYMALANTLNTTDDVAKIEKDTSGKSLHMRSAIQLAKNLDKQRTANQPWHWKYYAEDSHGSVPLIATYDAFGAIFKGHQFFPPADAADMSAALFEKHYAKVSALLGYKVSPPEQRINAMGYMMMRNDKLDKAYDFFNLNIENFPASFVVFDSMGDYYVAKGEKEKAIEHFKKALTLREFPETRKKLEKLASE